MSSNDNPGLEVLIKSLLESRGFDELQQKLKESSEGQQEHARSSEQAAEKSRMFDDAMGDLTGKLVEGLTVVALATETFNFFREALVGAIEESRQLNQFSMAMEAVGATTDEAKAHGKEWLEQLEQTSGKLKSELIPAYIKLAEVAGDNEKAQSLVQIAAGAAARGMGDLSSNATLLGRFLTAPNGPIKGTSALALEMKKWKTEGESTGEIMEKLAHQFGDGGAAVDNLGIKVDRAKVRWEQSKLAIGELWTSLVEKLAPGLETASKAVVGVIAVFDYLWQGIKTVITGLGTFGRMVMEVMAGNFKAAGELGKDWVASVQKNFADATDRSVALMEKVEDVWHKGSAAIQTEAQVAHNVIGLGITKVKATYKEFYESLLLEAKIASTGQIDLLNREIAIYKKMATDPAVKRVDQLKALVQVKAAEEEIWTLEQQHIKDRMAAEQKLADWLLKDANKRQKEYRKDVAERLKLADKEMKAHGKYDTQYTENAIAAYEAATKDFQIEEEKRNEYAEKALQLRMQLQQTELDGQREVAQEGLNLLGTVFGQTKELAIAQAIINTYEGATKALSQGGIYGVILAAIVIAAGLAQVAQIESSNPKKGGSGFDDPKNDFAAYVGGQKWANDMVHQWTSGIAAGFSGVMKNKDHGGGSSVTHNTSNHSARNSTYNIRLSGLFDSSSDIAMRRFTRNLQVATALEGKRTLR